MARALSAAGVKANERFLEGQLLGYFGAVVGVGRVLGLSTEQMDSTLGLALMQAGAINSIRYAQKLTGVNTIYALLGGLHLTGGIFEPIIPRTVKELKAIAPRLIMPGHCTGWKAIHALARELPEAFVQGSVGTRLVIESGSAA